MKITPPSGPSPAERSRLERKGASSPGFSPVFGDQPGPKRVGAGAPLTALGSILSVQEVEAGKQGDRERAVERGNELLDELQGLHLGMIDGFVSEGELHRLADLVAGTRSETDDPRLATLLEDIEIRAAVELTKLRR